MIAPCSFSGTHDWHPSVLNDTDADDSTAEMIIANIANGRCPRCERPLPHLPEYPAGSRVTQCRSIPICGRCGSDEVYEQLDGALSPASWWPLDIDEIEERRARWEAGVVPAFTDGQTIITEDGAGPIHNPRNTGGWAQYGGVPPWQR